MMKQILILIFILVGVWSCGESAHNGQTDENQQDKIVFNKDGRLQILDSVGNAVAKFDVELATDAYARETGLMYRKSMKEKNAMLFVFEQEKPLYFYMKNTYIPLDIIYINAAKKIVSIAKNAQPLDETTLPSNVPAKYALEVNAGIANQYGITTGLIASWQVL